MKWRCHGELLLRLWMAKEYSGAWRENRRVREGLEAGGRRCSIRFRAVRSEVGACLEQGDKKRGLTDWLGLERADDAALAFAFPVDGGHLDLVGGLWFQPNDS